MRWASNGTLSRGRTEAMTSGPKVRFGTKRPSITSNCMRSTPAFSRATQPSPKWAKSTGQHRRCDLDRAGRVHRSTLPRRLRSRRWHPHRANTSWSRSTSSTSSPAARPWPVGPTSRVVFVRGALPGERVRAEVVEHHGGYDRAELVEVMVPSPAPDRAHRVPPWRWGAGGAIFSTPRRRSQPALEGGHRSSTRCAGSAAWRSARRARAGPARRWASAPRCGRRSSGGRAGFRRHHSHDVVVTDRCLVAHPSIDELIARRTVRRGHRGDVASGGGHR